MAKALRANINLKSAISLEQGQFGLKFQVQGLSTTKHGIRISVEVSFI